jgi:hypothetical protein
MPRSQSGGPTEYPRGLFPQADRAMDKRRRDEVMSQLEGLSTEALQKVLEAAKSGAGGGTA